MKLLHRNLAIPSPGTTVTLIPFGCTHADDPGFHEDLWRQCVEEIKRTPHCLAIGMGDYKNFLRATARKHLQSYVADENSFVELDTLVKKEAKEFVVKWLMPIRDKLIGLAEGNHFYKFRNDTTDTQYMCDLLKVPYLDKPAFIRLGITFGKNTDKHLMLRILCHHADWSVGYQRAGGDVNAAEMKALGYDFDIYLFGHTHRRWAMKVPTITIPRTKTLRLIEKTRVFIRTGCFMRGLVEGCTGRYVEKKLLHPTDIGYVKLLISFHRRYDAEKYARLRQERPTTKARGAAYEPIVPKFEVMY